MLIENYILEIMSCFDFIIKFNNKNNSLLCGVWFANKPCNVWAVSLAKYNIIYVFFVKHSNSAKQVPINYVQLNYKLIGQDSFQISYLIILYQRNLLGKYPQESAKPWNSIELKKTILNSFAFIFVYCVFYFFYHLIYYIFCLS